MIVKALDGVFFEVMMDGIPYSLDYYIVNPVSCGGSLGSKVFTQVTRHPVHNIAAFALAHKDNINWIRSYPGTGSVKDALWAKLEKGTTGVQRAKRCGGECR